ncbi:IS66 family transposase [Acetobacterium fimetarium]|nr:transposase [Acetobacterium fimetarium]
MRHARISKLFSKRKGAIARQLLSGFKGYLTTDAYSAYK